MPDRTSTPPTAGGARSRRGGARLTLVIVLLVLAAGGAGVYAFMNGANGSGSGGTLELHRVAATSFDISVVANGELEAKQQTEIRSELESPAAIVEVAPEGHFVKKGDVLVRLATDALVTQREEELLRVESARSELIAAENGYEIQLNENEASRRQSQLKLDLAAIELQKFLEGDVIKKREELALEIDKAQRNLEQRTEQLDETQRLYEKGFASRDELQTSETALVEAQAAVKRSELERWIYETFDHDKQLKKLTSDVEEAEAELDRTLRKNDSQLANKEADRTNKRRQLAIREERLGKIDRQLAAATMIAPTDGLVVYATSVGRGRGMIMMGGDGPIQIGRNVRPNETIMALPATGLMVASVRVHESMAGRLRPGQKATVRIDALQNRTLPGRVESIGVLAETDGWRDPNLREYTVKVAIEADNSGQELKPSMRCEAEIVLGAVNDSLAVPMQAVFREGPVAFVYTPKGGKFARTPIRTGRRSSTFIEVAAGLEEGAQVLLRQPNAGEVLDTPFDEAVLASLAPPGRSGMPGAGGPGAMPVRMTGGAPGTPGTPGTPEGGAPMRIISGAPGGALPEGAQTMVVRGADGQELKDVKLDEKQLAEIADRARRAREGRGEQGANGAPAPAAPETAKAPGEGEAAPAQPRQQAVRPGARTAPASDND